MTTTTPDTRPDTTSGGPTGDQGPSGSDTNSGARPAQANPKRLAALEANDPNQTGGDEPESGAGYGNHAYLGTEPTDEDATKPD